MAKVGPHKACHAAIARHVHIGVGVEHRVGPDMFSHAHGDAFIFGGIASTCWNERPCLDLCFTWQFYFPVVSTSCRRIRTL